MNNLFKIQFSSYGYLDFFATASSNIAIIFGAILFTLRSWQSIWMKFPTIKTALKQLREWITTSPYDDETSKFRQIKPKKDWIVLILALVGLCWALVVYGILLLFFTAWSFVERNALSFPETMKVLLVIALGIGFLLVMKSAVVRTWYELRHK